MEKSKVYGPAQVYNTATFIGEVVEAIIDENKILYITYK